jgi:cytochrome P450
MTRRPPGPPNWTLGAGALLQIARDPLRSLARYAHQYGDLVYIRLGPFQYYLLNHPDYIHEVLVTQSRHVTKTARIREVLGQWAGNGLVVSEGETWLRQRRLMQPVFQPKYLRTYGETMEACTRRWLDGLSRRVGDQEIQLDIFSTVTDLTMDVTTRCLLGADLPHNSAVIGKAVDDLSQQALREMVQPFTLPLWLPLPSMRRKKQAMQLLFDLIRGLIARGRSSEARHADLLSLLLAARDEHGERMSDSQVQDEVMIMFLAGHDTTASCLGWTCYLLATHRAVQERVREEAASDVTGMPYTQQVLRESLRLYPPAMGVFAREAQADLSLGGYTVPKGSLLQMSSFITHRDARWFPHPERFDPERFAPGWEQRIPQFAYFPFGAGPRVCIGNSFAMQEMTLAITGLVREYRLAFPAGAYDPIPAAGMSVRPKVPLVLEIRRI